MMRVLTGLYLAALATTFPIALSTLGQAAQFIEPALNADGSFHAQLVTDPGRSYTVKVSTNATVWIPKYVYKNVGGQVDLLDPPGAEVGPVRFYRATEGTSLVSRMYFEFFGYGGAWNEEWVAAPLAVSVKAHLRVEHDLGYPAAEQVLLMGPEGSGVPSAPATEVNSGDYVSASFSTTAAVKGTWRATYRGTNLNFDLPEPQVASRLVIPFPAVREDPAGLHVSWRYLDGQTGTPLPTPPQFVTSVEVSLTPEVTSGPLPGTVTQYTFGSIGLPRDATLQISYRDTLGNFYRLTFSELKP